MPPPELILGFAVVIRWDANLATVHCPFCDKPHKHLISHLGDEFWGKTATYKLEKQPPCSPASRYGIGYEVLFPFGKDPRVAGLAFEIRPQIPEPLGPAVGHRFCTVGLGGRMTSDEMSDVNRQLEQIDGMHGLATQNIEPSKLWESRVASGSTDVPENLAGAFFFRPANKHTAVFVAPIAGIDLGREWEDLEGGSGGTEKTVGLLVRGPPFPIIAAVSGWSGGTSARLVVPQYPGAHEQLNGGYWMRDAIRLVESIDCPFPKDEERDDPDIPGSFYASHVEAMLMTYFVRSHCLKEGDADSPSTFRLHEGQPKLKRACILVSRKQCEESCVPMRDILGEEFGIEFDVRELEMLGEARRGAA